MIRIIDKHLLEWKDSSNRKPLIIRGLRQVGKTYSVTRFAKQSFDDNIAIFDFERDKSCHQIFSGDLLPQRLLMELEVHIGKKIIPGKALVFFDEIQACPRALMSLRYFYEQMPELHVIAAGSLLEFAIEDISFPVGRVQFLWMYPMTFSEFLRAHGLEILDRQRSYLDTSSPVPESIHKKLLEQLRYYFVVGGLPEAVFTFVQRHSLPEVAEIHKTLVRSYKQDFSKYAGRTDRECLEHVFEQIPLHVGEQIKYTTLYPEKRIDQIKRSLRILEQALVIRKIFSTSAQGLPLSSGIHEKVFKYVFCDIGLMQSMAGANYSRLIEDKDLMGTYRGSLAEQFVGQEILAKIQGPEDVRLYYWCRYKRGSSAEVDYLMVDDGKIIPIEVKSGPAGKLRSLHLFIEEHRHSPLGIVFNTGNVQWLEEQRLHFLPIYTRV